jgi:hypothetical protein
MWFEHGTPMIGRTRKRRWLHASEVGRGSLEPTAALLCSPGDHAARSWREVAAVVDHVSRKERSVKTRVMYALVWLAALAIAIGASWRPD